MRKCYRGKLCGAFENEEHPDICQCGGAMTVKN
jgi:hypothetical protein